MKSSNNNLIKIGKVLEAKGLRGEVRVLFFSGDASWADSLEEVFLSENHVKHKVLKVSENNKKDRCCLSLEGIQDRTQAEALKGQEVYIEELELQSEQGEEIFLREVIGFDVFDKEKHIGQVERFESNTAQDLLVLKFTNAKGEEDFALIPFVNDFIVDIDFDQSKIIMDLPEGLI